MTRAGDNTAAGPCGRPGPVWSSRALRTVNLLSAGPVPCSVRTPCRSAGGRTRPDPARRSLQSSPMTRITTRTVEYPADGVTMIGHLALPAGVDRRPAVLVGPEGMGLSDVERRRADALAELGYVALAFDLHGGRYLGDPEEMLARCMPLLADPDRMRGIGHAALDVLRSEPRTDPDRIAAIGYGTGGPSGLNSGATVSTCARSAPSTQRPRADRARRRAFAARCGPGSGRRTRSWHPRNGTRLPLRCRPRASTGASRSTAEPCTPSTTRRSTTPWSPASATTHSTRSARGTTSSACSPSACPWSSTWGHDPSHRTSRPVSPAQAQQPSPAPSGDRASAAPLRARCPQTVLSSDRRVRPGLRQVVRPVVRGHRG
ncbi:hypothetical protein SXANM310S_02729 [Streptomyces xanthochromogenes]